MRQLLAALMHIAQRTGRFTVAEVTLFYNRLWLAMGLVLLSCGAAYVLNAHFGERGPSFLLAVTLGFIAVYVWGKPLHLLIVAGVGVARRILGEPDLAQQIEEALKVYLNEVLKWFLLVVGTFLAVTGTIPFEEYPAAGRTILLALGVIGLFIWAWPKVFVGALGRKSVYTAAVIVLVCSFLWLIPGPMWVKYMPYSFNPKALGTTPTEKTLYAIQKARTDKKEEAEDQVLRRILKKVRAGEPLAADEDAFLRHKEAVAAAKAEGDKPASSRRPAECTPKNPCALAIRADGSTERGTVPEGKSLCFDAYFFANLPRLGYATSYKGRPAMKPGCTATGCFMDAFWFEPETGVEIPRHWFTPEGSTC